MKARQSIITAILGFVACFLLFSPVFSQEQTTEIIVGADGITSNVGGSTAKAREYKDKKTDGVYGTINMKHDSPNYFLQLQGSDMGYDTQHYRLEGGPYGKYRYYFDYNEIIHNITTDAKSSYDGAGSSTLTGNPVNSNPAAWSSTFDYFTKRKKADAGANISVAKPFFLDVPYNYEKKDGIKPAGVSASTTSPGTYAIELPEPIDYTTNNLKVEAGYMQNPYTLSVNYLYSNFRNGIMDLYFTNPASTADNKLSLPPDSALHKFGLKGSARLPFNSKFSVNLSDSQGTSSTTSLTTFDGKVNTRNYDLVLSSAPLRFVDAKAYYKYNERDTRSTDSSGT